MTPGQGQPVPSNADKGGNHNLMSWDLKAPGAIQAPAWAAHPILAPSLELHGSLLQIC